LWAGATILLVAATGLATRRFIPSSATSHTGAGGADDADAIAATQPRLLEGHDYYFHVKLIELDDHLPGGKPWDRLDNSGPDIRFSLTWRKNVIWKSIEKPDTLIGSWDLLRVDLRKAITGGQTDLEGMVNAPLVHYGAGESVRLKVWDEDTVGSDDAGDLMIKLDDLRPGDNTFAPAHRGGNIAIKRLVIAMIDRRTPLPDLVNMISNR
jgi:hypothetical protein